MFDYDINYCRIRFASNCVSCRKPYRVHRTTGDCRRDVGAPRLLAESPERPGFGRNCRVATRAWRRVPIVAGTRRSHGTGSCFGRQRNSPHQKVPIGDCQTYGTLSITQAARRGRSSGRRSVSANNDQGPDQGSQAKPVVLISSSINQKSMRRRHEAGRQGTASVPVIVVMVLFGLATAFGLSYFLAIPSKQSGSENSTLTPRETGNAQPPSKNFNVVARKPTGPPRVFTGLKDVHGNPVTVACSTCHSTRPPNHANKTLSDLNEFHGSLSIHHGSLSCLSCHNSNDYDSLKLADGSRVEFTDVMTLCAQCHGPQMRDFEHGVHGGMNGYWDLNQGPQTRNNCVDCHQPHVPRFPKMLPDFKPRDRFLEKDIH